MPSRPRSSNWQSRGLLIPRFTVRVRARAPNTFSTPLRATLDSATGPQGRFSAFWRLGNQVVRGCRGGGKSQEDRISSPDKTVPDVPRGPA